MGRRSDGITLTEMLVVIAIVIVLAALLLPLVYASRVRTEAVKCLGNLRQIGIALTMYTKDEDGYYPCVRWTSGPQLRWPHAIRTYVGGYLSQRHDICSEAANGNRVTNAFFICPAVRASKNQSKGERVYFREGSYGYNWGTFGPFYPNTAGDGIAPAWRYPVHYTCITRPSGTIIVADSFGNADLSDCHAHTLDGPRLLHGHTRWGAKGGPTPMDNRHSGRGNCAFADGRATPLTMREAGYSQDDPTKVDGTGNNSLWTGTGDDQ